MQDLGGVWESVEEGDMGWDVVAFGWEVGGAETLEEVLGIRIELEGQDVGQGAHFAGVG
jgi:hypothetical protein